MRTSPLAIDLFCGLGGWTDGLLAEGYRVIGFDNEYKDYPGQLVIQDVRTLHGRQFKDAALIVASPPCQEYSYMAMPWSKAKAIVAEYRSGVRDVKKLTALFDACFRIQRQACDAAGHHIPLIVENVRGAIPWVGRSRWNFGSFHLWGDVPALMPIVSGRQVMKNGVSHRSNAETNFHGHIKNSGGSWFRIAHNTTSGKGQNPDGRKIKHNPHMTNPAEHIKNGGDWFGKNGDYSPMRHMGSKSNSRKVASAMIARIPFTLAKHIAWAWRPREL